MTAYGTLYFTALPSRQRHSHRRRSLVLTQPTDSAPSQRLRQTARCPLIHPLIRMALRCSESDQPCCLCRVLRHIFAFGVHTTEIMLRLGVAHATYSIVGAENRDDQRLLRERIAYAEAAFRRGDGGRLDKHRKVADSTHLRVRGSW